MSDNDYDYEDDGNMNVAKLSVKDLLGKQATFRIPFFQRSYVWDEEEWERFLEDVEAISKNGKDYFMGFIVLKTTIAGFLAPATLVIDGQQRLTTILMFLKVLCEMKEDYRKNVRLLKNSKPILEHNHNDIRIFNAIMENTHDEKMLEEYEDSNILRCYQYFSNYFSNEKNINNINLDNVLKHLFIICLDLTGDDDEQQIFDTINSLGVSLTLGELLKNELFNQNDLKFYNETWRQVFEKNKTEKKFWDGKIFRNRENRTNMDIILRSYLYIKDISSLKEKKRGLNNLFSNYKVALKKYDKKEFINGLMDCARKYKEFINKEHVKDKIGNGYVTQRLNIIIFGLKFLSIIPYIMYILDRVEDEVEQAKIFKLVEIYIMRRVIAKSSSKNYNLQFAEFIRDEIDSYDKLHALIYGYTEVTDKMPSDADMENSITNFKTQSPRVVLYFIEAHAGRKNSMVAIDGYDSFNNVEHVMPKKWQTHWNKNAKGEKLNEKETEERDIALERLGNLTLLNSGFNSSLSNLSWEDKKNGRKLKNGVQQDGLEKCCAGIETMREYFKNDSWDENTIKERGKELCEYAKELWPYEG